MRCRVGEGGGQLLNIPSHRDLRRRDLGSCCITFTDELSARSVLLRPND